MTNSCLLGIAALALVSCHCLAQGGVDQSSEAVRQDRFTVGFQATFIEQGLLPFHSPYSGANSLPSISQARLSDTYTLFLGARVANGLEAFVNPEMARGAGIGDTLGLGGFTNGDVIRNPSLGQDPYWGRAFLRWTIATGPEMETVNKDDNLFAGARPTHRVVLTGGKFGTNDIFDTNDYSNSTRTQFINWALINNPSYDYAADTRGYTQGVSAEWITPDWALRIGSFLMPVVANGIDLDSHVRESRGDQIEFEGHPNLFRGHRKGTLKLLAYRNIATMGDYDQSLATAGGGVPDITASRQRGRVKYGFGLNATQPLADDGETGLFGRLGWSDGKTESFAYTEADDHLSLGVQISGRRWRRHGDLAGLALVSDGLSNSHKNYLVAGGSGFILGDRQLNYGRESILETYYLHTLSSTSNITLGSQLIANPGYNRDRGPVATFSLRFHVHF